MKTLFLVLSTLWTVARKTPTLLSLLWVLVRCTPAILRQLPAALALINKIRAVFGSEAVQELVKALYAFIDQMTSSASIADGDTPDNPNQEQQRRLFRFRYDRLRCDRFRNRLEVAGIITDAEAQEICALHNIDSRIDSFQYA